MNIIELIEEKEDEIIEKMKEAYMEALTNQHLAFSVVLDTSDGDVFIQQTLAGNSFSFVNDYYRLLWTFECQYYDFMSDFDENTTEDDALDFLVNDNIHYYYDILNDVKQEIEREQEQNNNDNCW